MADPLPQVDMSDDVMLRIMRDPNFTNEFPFLATTLARASARKPGCGGCSRKNRSRQMDLGVVRRQLVELPPDKKLKLKQLLNTNQVVIRYRQPNGVLHKLKF